MYDLVLKGELLCFRGGGGLQEGRVSLLRTVSGNDSHYPLLTSGHGTCFQHNWTLPIQSSSPTLEQNVPLAAAAGDQCVSHLYRVRLIARQGSTVSEEREMPRRGFRPPAVRGSKG